MITRPLFGVLLAIAACLVGRAQGVVSYVGSVPNTTTDWNSTITLPSFDTSLGTLTQVKLTFSATSNQMVQAENVESVTRTYNLQSTMSLSLTRPDNSVAFSATPIVLSHSGSLAAFDGTIDFGGTSGVTFQQQVPISMSLLDTNLAAYTTGSPLHFTSHATDTTAMTSSGNVVEQATSSASTQLGIEYSYSPVPEPATFAAWLGAGAFVLALVRRRTRPGSPLSNRAVRA